MKKMNIPLMGLYSLPKKKKKDCLMIRGNKDEKAEKEILKG